MTESQNSGMKTKEEYESYSLREHILKRPENYIGSTSKQQNKLWVVEKDNFVHKLINYAPGLYRIYDDILINAADNCNRDPPTKTIQVEINQEEGYISIWNDGKGIPINQLDTSCWIPEIIFGHFNKESFTGFGTKFANIYSKLFIIECKSINPNDGKFYQYVQRFTNHIETIEKPTITEITDKQSKPSTKVTFYPDLQLFHMDKLDDDIISLFSKRCYDLAGCLSNCSIYLNGKKIQINNFDEYCKKYLPNGSEFFSIEINERFKIGISPSDGTFNQVSFVNYINTYDGGTHVNLIADQITKYIAENGFQSVNTKFIKQYLFLFVNCLLDKPFFNSQTREILTTPIQNFENYCRIPESFLKNLNKTSIYSKIKEFLELQKQKSIREQTIPRKISGIDYFIDANKAKSSKSMKCTLIVTFNEADFAIANKGLSILGNDLFGVYKFRNSFVSIRNSFRSNEFTDFFKIMNISPSNHNHNENEIKESINQLRYGSIMLMTNQDLDGFKVKGMFIEVLNTYCPYLLSKKGFLSEFVTPLIKVTKKKEEKEEEENKKIVFYSIPEFEYWTKSHDNAKDYYVKFYNSLSTSNDEEIFEYFTNIKRNRVIFEYTSKNDSNKIQLALNKRYADERKQWLAEIDPKTRYLGQIKPSITYSNFIDNEFILFNYVQNKRSIASVVDGFKPTQRKVLWTMFKQNINKDIKVKNLATKVTELSCYKYGELSLTETIIGMAQDFVGSNNINLLYPSGQFGSRFFGGKDVGSSNYIYTRLNKIARIIFNKDDDQLLEYLTEEGVPIEPKYFVPIIPMVLVNGSEGIGFGWSSNVPCFNPLDIIKNIRHKINNEEMEEMIPWYSGFTGEIKCYNEEKPTKKWIMSGICKQTNQNIIEISEIPIGSSTLEYKNFLESLLPNPNPNQNQNQFQFQNQYQIRKNCIFTDFVFNNHNDIIYFKIFCKNDQTEKINHEMLNNNLKLSKNIIGINMNLFSPEDRIKQYKSANQIIDDFYLVRLKLYEERKVSILENLHQNKIKISNQARFIKEFNEGQIELRNVSKENILLNLKERKYDLIDTKNSSKIPKTVFNNAIEIQSSDDDDNDNDVFEQINDPLIKKLSDGYDYILSLFSKGFSQEIYLKLTKKEKEIEERIKCVNKKSPKELWIDDLDILEKEYKELESLRQRKRDSEKSKLDITKLKHSSSTDSDDE